MLDPFLAKKPKPSYLGHRERLRRRFETSEFDGLLDHEILEIILACIIPRMDTKPLSWDLIRSGFGVKS
ncbi:MAG: hypothetical protein HY747_02375 [Elusimicrobia bacterium]|nr:hypothetical protein [Elusimicrobiota bacterium]